MTRDDDDDHDCRRSAVKDRIQVNSVRPSADPVFDQRSFEPASDVCFLLHRCELHFPIVDVALADPVLVGLD